ncbi:undecaprenyl-diphosphatase [Desulfohalotomaculum tongense]|uniref:undecaprenyl-diphosphate phosphatase n=1 Tax=Desulforadius tongensis TaxID=1216062 RepID=UPI0019569BDF|nr:undecaprenyl-diphosphate phosphatase [Desulforadius tongensis]MBM7854463.1 undecaprenyl-diphosphatase [Desulforadius tongensis]
MTDFQAFILGVVQGLGEFLPISSSAHLVLVPWLFGWPYAGLTFDVALHMGTLVAVIAFFWRDWIVLASDGLRLKGTREGKLFWYLVAATIPGAAFGYAVEDYAETIFRTPILIGIMLIVMGAILYVVDRRAPKIKDMNKIGLKESLFVGVLQSLAIIPGVSRAGITMTAGRAAGMTRETAARFSFLLSTPIIFGAGVMQLKDIDVSDLDRAFFTGIITSAIVGFLSIKFLLKYLTEKSFNVFVWYRFAAGALVIAVELLRR